MSEYEEKARAIKYKKAKHECPICEERRCHPECPRHPESTMSLRVRLCEMEEKCATLVTVTAMLAQQVSQLVDASDKSKD